jgi:hypothetical protein
MKQNPHPKHPTGWDEGKRVRIEDKPGVGTPKHGEYKVPYAKEGTGKKAKFSDASPGIDYPKSGKYPPKPKP